MKLSAASTFYDFNSSEAEAMETMQVLTYTIIVKILIQVLYVSILMLLQVLKTP